MPQSSSSGRQIGRNALKLFTGTLASRALGFVREMLAAHYFGGRAAMDVYNVALMVPNLFRGVLAEQAVESAFLPTFKELLTQGKVSEAWRTASVVLNWLILALALVVILCLVFAPLLVSGILAPGFNADKAGEAAQLGRLMAPFMLLIGLAAFFGSLLLAHGQFWAYGMAPTLFNVSMIASVIFLYRPLGLRSLAVGVLVGGLLEFIGSAVPLIWGRRRGLVQGRYHPSEGLADDSAVRVFHLAIPVCAAALIARCDYMVARAVASFLEVGSIAALGYALQLVLLPFALFGLSVGRAALVPLAEHAANGEAAGFQRALGSAVRLGLVLLIPLSVGTALLAHPLAALFQSGKFGPGETDMTAAALRWYALGLASMGLVSILSRALYALKDTKAALRAAVRALVANAFLSAALALTPLRHGGIALAASLALTFQTALLFIALRGKLRIMGTIERGHWFGKSFLRVLVGTTVMALVVIGLGPLAAAMALAVLDLAASAPVWLPWLSLASRLLRVLVPGSGGAAVYGLVMFLLDRATVLRVLRRKAEG